MVETIRVSEGFYSWVEAHKKDDETTEETLRRLTRDSHPSEVADALSEEQVVEVEEAIEELHERDSKRLQKVQDTISEEARDDDLARLLARYDREKHRKIYDDLASE